MRRELSRLGCFSVVLLLGADLAPSQQPISPQPRAGNPAAKNGGQDSPQPAASAAPASDPHRIPVSQYSPLAAQGGYRSQQTTWYEALFRSLNPKNVDWGMKWEQRRTIFLENSVGNKYFMYTAVLSLLLIYSVVVVVWQRWNHSEGLQQLAQRTADALNYASYWKEHATSATSKHNAHIEKCNRVIETGDSGSPTGGSEASELRHQIETLRVEVLSVTSEKKRLQHDLDQKSAMVSDLSTRVDEATRKLGSGNGPGKRTENPAQVATLVDRINRLEEALRVERAENQRLKGV